MTRSALLLALIALLAAGCASDPEEASPVSGHDHDAPVENTSLTDAADQKWTCGMHPHIVEDEPGQCPICGMDLVPIGESGSSEGVVEIDPVTVQNMGVRTATAEMSTLSHSVRTSGQLEVDGRRRTVVSPKIGGWVERLHVEYDGARVRKGQPLLEIYSPELVSTQEEYLLALRNAERMRSTEAGESADRLLEAARRRLAYWDISDQQIERLEETGEPTKTLTLYAPSSGVVSDLNVTEGERIQSGQALMRLTDLQNVWVIVDLHEQELAWIDEGAQARVELPYAPGQPIAGEVSFLYDTVEEGSRTVRARVELPNREGKLKPGMYATVTIEGEPSDPAPTVPAEAVLRGEETDVVVLALGEGRFRPVEVTAGRESGGRVQILEGLEGGERVVTSAQFLIDSEARLKSAVGAMAGHQHGGMEMGDDRQNEMQMDGSSHDEQGLVGSVKAAHDSVEGAAHAGHGMKPGSMPMASGGIDVPALDENGDGIVYQCPMHPHEIQDHDGDCPECGMYLDPRPVAEAQAALAN